MYLLGKWAPSVEHGRPLPVGPAVKGENAHREGGPDRTANRGSYDIHGNLPALDAVLREVREAGCDAIVIGGDVAGGYMPAETVSLLMTLRGRTRFVMGNGDREMLRILDGEPPAPGFAGRLNAWAARRLDPEARDFLAAFEPVVEHDVAGVGRVLFCHGTPDSDEEIVTPETPDEVLDHLASGADADVIVGGHTHVRMDRRAGGKRFLNPGSVGMPYGGTGAWWLVLGPGVEMRRTRYDLAAAAAAVRATGGPGASEFALENVLQTPTAAEAIDVFERQAGRRP